MKPPLLVPPHQGNEVRKREESEGNHPPHLTSLWGEGGGEDGVGRLIQGEEVRSRAEARQPSITSLFAVAEPERRARLRSLRLAARLLCGPRGQELERALHAAEHDETALAPALVLLDALTPLDRRRVLGSWAQTLGSPPGHNRLMLGARG